MEILLNELSLNGQFATVSQFVEDGVPPLLGVLKDLGQEDLVYKSYNFFNSRVTIDTDIHTVLTGNPSRNFDEIRRLKIYLVRLFENPYWEDNPKHSDSDPYFLKNRSISGTSLAETCKRDCTVISFICDHFSDTPIVINNGKHDIYVENLRKNGDYYEASWKLQKISFEEYCNKKYNNKTKLNFSTADTKKSFIFLKQDSDIELYKEGFEKFHGLTWQQIITDDALEYKEYHNKKYFKHIPHKIYKFRITQKYRCFGFVSSSVFNVICFDLTHELSDKG